MKNDGENIKEKEKNYLKNILKRKN